MHKARDAGGDRIVFDAGELAGRAQRGREQGEEQAGAHAGFQHAAPGEAQPRRGAPEPANDRLGRVVGVLGGALEGGVFLRRDGGFERRADLLPAGPEAVLAGTAEAVLRQLRGAEADEAQQLRLLAQSRRAARLLKRLRQTDRGDVVARPGGPALGKFAITGKMEVAAARGRNGGNGRLAAAYRHRRPRLPRNLEAADGVGGVQPDNAVLSNRLSVNSRCRLAWWSPLLRGVGSRAAPAAWRRSSRTAACWSKVPPRARPEGAALRGDRHRFRRVGRFSIVGGGQAVRRSGLADCVVGMEGEQVIGDALRVRRRPENLLAVRAKLL